MSNQKLPNYLVYSTYCYNIISNLNFRHPCTTATDNSRLDLIFNINLQLHYLM